MEITAGTFKKVFIFNSFVVKIPKHFTYESFARLYWEQINYYTSPKHIRKLLLKCIFIPFIPISFQKRVMVEFPIGKDDRIRDIFLQQIKDSGVVDVSEYIADHAVLHDLSGFNAGYVDGKIKKIDYDATYRIWNWYCEIRSLMKKFIKDIKIRVFYGKFKERI